MKKELIERVKNDDLVDTTCYIYRLNKGTGKLEKLNIKLLDTVLAINGWQECKY